MSGEPRFDLVTERAELLELRVVEFDMAIRKTNCVFRSFRWVAFRYVESQPQGANAR
jgi:hypothetical protein